MLDIFDALDSELKRISSGKSKQASSVSFARYNSWFDAHEFVVEAEKTKALDGARVKVRLLAQAGLLGADDASISDGSLLDGDGDSIEMSDEESLDKDTVGGDSDDESGEEESVASREVAADGAADDNESESGSSEDGEESSDEDEEGDEFDEAAAEAEYLRQLHDEEFESELRKLTMDALERGKVSARTGAGNKVSSQMPVAPQFVAKKQSREQSHSQRSEGDSAVSPFEDGEEKMAFKLFKRGNKGKQEEVQLFVPKSTNLARVATKHDDEAAKERDMLKARVLQYEAASADAVGGNVYLGEETKLQVIRNRPLTMETLERNFGKSSSDGPYKVSERFRGRGPGRGRGRGPGRGRGGGRLFNPGRSPSGK